jgi:hypothetical protein
VEGWLLGAGDSLPSSNEADNCIIEVTDPEPAFTRAATQYDIAVPFSKLGESTKYMLAIRVWVDVCAAVRDITRNPLLESPRFVLPLKIVSITVAPGLQLTRKLAASNTLLNADVGTIGVLRPTETQAALERLTVLEAEETRLRSFGKTIATDWRGWLEKLITQDAELNFARAEYTNVSTAPGTSRNVNVTGCFQLVLSGSDVKYELTWFV